MSCWNDSFRLVRYVGILFILVKICLTGDLWATVELVVKFFIFCERCSSSISCHESFWFLREISIWFLHVPFVDRRDVLLELVVMMPSATIVHTNGPDCLDIHCHYFGFGRRSSSSSYKGHCSADVYIWKESKKWSKIKVKCCLLSRKSACKCDLSEHLFYFVYSGYFGCPTISTFTLSSCGSWNRWLSHRRWKSSLSVFKSSPLRAAGIYQMSWCYSSMRCLIFMSVCSRSYSSYNLDWNHWKRRYF